LAGQGENASEKESEGTVRRFITFGISIFCVTILVLLALPDSPVVAQGAQPVLRFTPLALGLKPAAQGSVDIVIENVHNLYGVEIHLAFDPQIVQGIDANPDEKGIQIEPAGWWKDGFVAVNTVDNGNGVIDFAATLLRPAPPASGNLTIATITCAGRHIGTSALTIRSAILATGNAQILPYTKQEGKIGVNPGGKAPDMRAKASAPAPGRLLLAGAAFVTFLAALAVFILAVIRRK
jgi:hypothetical protein